MADKDEFLRMVAAFDQAAAQLRPLAQFLGQYRKALVEAGFSEGEAFELVLEAHRHLWGAMHLR